MRLSPLDIRQQQFTVRMLRGLDPQEVEAFLEDVAEEYEQVLKENVTLREQVGVHEERARRVNEVERMLTETLVTTQKLTDEMKDAARRDGQLLVREAEMQGEKVMEAARAEEAKIRSGIKDIQRTHRQLLEDLKSTVERYQRLLTSESDLEGAANAAVVTLIARALGVRPSAVRVVRGERGRDKWLSVDGMTAAAIRERLA